MAIVSFADAATEAFFVTGRVPRRTGWAGCADAARRKLDMLHYAQVLADLRSPPGNRLEALRGGRRGFHRVRVNDQWRVVFRWTQAGPADVEICDYH